MISNGKFGVKEKEERVDDFTERKGWLVYGPLMPPVVTTAIARMRVDWVIVIGVPVYWVDEVVGSVIPSVV